MTIDDQIRDEKLLYDINREAAKISILSSDKFKKYEYFTGEETLPSNKKQMIEQVKLTYSPLGKAFEKQIKRIKSQGGKQIKAIQNQWQVKTIRKYIYNDEDSPSISKQKEIFNKFGEKRLDDITELDKKVSLDDLIYRYKGKTPDEKFDEYDDALNLINKIKNGEIKLAEAKNDQIRFKSNLDEIKKENNKKRLKEQKNTPYNIDMFYKARNKVTKFFDDYSSMVSEAKNKAKNEGKGLFSPKQLL